MYLCIVKKHVKYQSFLWQEKYALVEIKIGGMSNIITASKQLQKLAKKINTEKMGEPAFCMVLTAVGDEAYRLEDGTFVVPIGCLKH